MESFLEAWDLICDYCKKQVTDVSYCLLYTSDAADE